MTCNTISLVSRLIWKRFRWKFIDIFEDVCSLHSCFSADSFHLLCCITPCESSGRFFRATRYIYIYYIKNAYTNPSLATPVPCCCDDVTISIHVLCVSTYRLLYSGIRRVDDALLKVFLQQKTILASLDGLRTAQLIDHTTQATLMPNSHHLTRRDAARQNSSSVA